MTTKWTAPALGELDTFAYANGYADGVRDKSAGMVAYLDADFHGLAYLDGYEAGVIA